MLKVIKGFLGGLDPKVVSHLVTSALLFLLLKVGIGVTPVVSGYVAIVVGAVVGWLIPNQASQLRAGTHPVQALLHAARAQVESLRAQLDATTKVAHPRGAVTSTAPVRKPVRRAAVKPARSKGRKI